ncbi:MAG: hypothetical protein ABI720_01645 [Actinomycetes bacterium]
MELVAVGLSLLLTLLAVIVGMAKVQRLPASAEVRDRANVAPAIWTVSGWVELVAGGFLVVGIFAAHEAAILASIVLAVSYGILAIRQLSQSLPLAAATPALVLCALGAATALSIVAAG